MRKFLLVATCACLFFLSPQMLFYANGQAYQAKAVPSDSALLSLVNKYVHTTIKKTISANGDVFLQRDMTQYLQANVSQAPNVKPSEVDHGHDHKDAMLRTFLNRPQPNIITLNKYFNQAASEFSVPVSILKASAQVQSNWAQVSESMYGSWGIMGLVENQFVQQISKASLLLHVSANDIKNDAKTNIRAAAALLAFYKNGTPAATLEDWFEPVKSLTGLWDPAMKNELAVRIYDVMKTGSKTVSLWGEIISIEPVGVALPKSVTEPDAEKTTPAGRTTAVDYPNAIPNFTTCNFNSRPAGSIIKYYFVHYVATGTYQGAVNWFKDCSSSVSAHYVIRNNDGEVSQVVAEADRAWSQGVTSYNDLGIGVEHEVLATNLSMWDSPPMLAAAGSLCSNVCNRRAIPKVRRVNNGDPGIYGHSDVRATDCPNMTPARWANFMSRVNSVNVAPPTLYSIANAGSATQVTATWKPNIESNLAGYRLYYATSDALTKWALAANETTLTATTTSVTLNTSQFVVPPTGNVYHFKLTAVVTDGTNPVVESSASDIYARSSNTTGPKVLIVDGFDRFGGTGSYQNSTHPFVTSYFKSLRNKASLQISSVANEKVEDGTFVLNNYDIVVWFVGDESSANVVLSTSEKNAIKSFLDNGGKLLFSGSEAAYNIGRSAPGSTTYDLPFMSNYLKSTYVGDGLATYTPATGVAGTAFEGLNIPFGIIYPEDFPDAINPINGSISILNYSVASNKGGIAYKGTFGTGTTPGALIFLSFTLETAADTSITSFMDKALVYFGVPTVTIPTANEDAATTQSGAAKRINVLANDYNNGAVLNTGTLQIVTNPANGTVTTDNNGNVTYTSIAGFTGNDSYEYKVQNTNGQFSNNAAVSITVVAATTCNPNAPEVEDMYPKRELRGAWISTVSNIDWPSSRTLSTSQQQAELIRILDTLSKTGINTVYLQVRPEADALYASTIDPWSYWLTNAQGTPPNPLWDPLAFAINAAHARGMELHAWLNPYRAKQSTPALAANHVAILHPDWTFAAGTLTMLNPGLPQVRNYLAQVIGDIATRYDVDGIHFDDYFYPATGLTNQDSVTYMDNNPTAISTIADWRRNNVNLLIAKVYDTLSAINTAGNRNVIFGVSPFGIWKSGTPAGITGTSSFSAMYCDPIAWLQAGKVDYVAPQLYWKITGPQDYNALSKWWNEQGETYNRYIYPGLALYKMSDVNNWAPGEIENQILLNRDENHQQVKGQVLFSTQQLMNNIKGIKNTLQNNGFSYNSFAPAMPWKDSVCPNAPVNVRRDMDSLKWDSPATAADGDLPKKYVVYKFTNATEAITHKNDGKKVYAIVYGNKLALTAADAASSSYFMVTALDKNNNESEGSSGITLPVTGLELIVKLSGNTTMVNWSTLTEINTKNFEVERSTDGRSFKYITSVIAAGTSTEERNYNIQDFLPATGTYYYRIKSSDNDGRSSYSGVKSVVYKRVSDEIVLGPNPFVSGINISNMHQVQRLDIIDLTGRTLITKTVSNQTTTRIDAPGLPAGLYNIKVTIADGKYSYIKIVKM
ncbi:MAG TPA: family 10 glycosylhydrolase [Segetibacter sp.]